MAMPRVALVHDWLNQVGGAEDVLQALVAMFPDAPLYTSFYAPDQMPSQMQSWNIRTSFMNRLPGIAKHHQAYLPIYPLAFESFDFSGYDLVLSNKSGFCHGVITPPETTHVCYCLTPTRFLWMYESYRQREGLGRVSNAALRPILAQLRVWDRLAADRVDHFIAISTVVRERIRKFYRRESEIIAPPVDIQRFQPKPERSDYFLIVSRLIPYKRIDLAVQAFNKLGLPLWIGGEGRDRAELERMAKPNIRFLGRVPDADLPDLMAHCRAFIFPSLEDFGITPVQAQAAGRPVIAYGAGGALDTVIPGISGVYFQQASAESLAATVAQFKESDYDPTVIRSHAEQFSVSEFERKLSAFLAGVLG